MKERDREVKKLLTAVLVLVVLVTLSVSACASLFQLAEHGLGIPISFGTEVKPTTGKLVFVDQMGKVLTPNDGVLAIPDDAGTVTGYIIPDEVDRIDRYDIRWGLTVISKWEQLQPMESDSKIGWRFQITPDEYGQIGNLRTLTLMVKQYDAKHWFVRIIFKLTYAKGSVKTSDHMILTVVPAAKAPVGESIATIVAEVNKRFDATASYVSKLEERVTKIENHLSDKTKTSEPAPRIEAPAPPPAYEPVAPARPAPTKVDFTIYVNTRASGLVSVQIGNEVLPGYMHALTLEPGTYRAKVKVGNRSTDWVSFEVFPRMEPVTITAN